MRSIPSDFFGTRMLVLLEGGIVAPQVDAVGDRGCSAFKDCRGLFWHALPELSVGILLPVAIAEREFGKETVVDLPQLGNVALLTKEGPSSH